MNRYLNAGVVALTAAGAILATAAPAAAQNDNHNSANHQSGATGHRAGSYAGGATRSYSGGYQGGYRGGYGGGGYGGGYRGYGGGYDNDGYYAGAALAGLAVGAAIGGGYGGYGGYGYDGYGYGGGYYAPYGGCASQQWVWSPRSGRYLLRTVPYAC